MVVGTEAATIKGQQTSKFDTAFQFCDCGCFLTSDPSQISEQSAC